MAAICDERGSWNNAIRESFPSVASVLPASPSDLFLKAKKYNCTKAQRISPPSMIADNVICLDPNVTLQNILKKRHHDYNHCLSIHRRQVNFLSELILSICHEVRQLHQYNYSISRVLTIPQNSRKSQSKTNVPLM
jgi:hypothetical protein